MPTTLLRVKKLTKTKAPIYWTKVSLDDVAYKNNNYTTKSGRQIYWSNGDSRSAQLFLKNHLNKH